MKTWSRLGKLLVSGAVVCSLLAAPAVAEAAADKPALWKVHDDDSTIWIFGSFHALPEGLEWRAEEFDAAVAAADRVWFETDLSPDALASFAQTLMSAGANPEGGLLASLSEEHRATLEATAKELGFSASMLDLMRPWYAALTLVQFGALAQGFNPMSGVELTIQREAVAAEKPIAGLETAEEHLALFTTLSPEAQREFLESTIEELDEVGPMLAKIREAWMSQDFAALVRLGEESFGEVHGEIEATLLDDRNEAWVAQIEEILAGSGEELIVVGALHTVGEKGIVAMLRAKGHAVDGPTTVSATAR